MAWGGDQLSWAGLELDRTGWCRRGWTPLLGSSLPGVQGSGLPTRDLEMRRTQGCVPTVPPAPSLVLGEATPTRRASEMVVSGGLTWGQAHSRCSGRYSLCPGTGMWALPGVGPSLLPGTGPG